MLEPPFDVEKLLIYAEDLGASEIEVMLKLRRVNRLEAKANSLQRAVAETSATLGVRAAVGKKVGSAGGEISGFAQAIDILEAAVKNAKSSPEDPEWPGFNPHLGKAPYSPMMYDEETANAPPEQLSSALKYSIREAAEAGAVVAEGWIITGESRVIVLNSYGGPLDEAYTGFHYAIEVKKKEGGREATSEDYTSKGRFEEDRVRLVTERALKRVNDALNAVRVEPFKGSLVLSPQEASGFIEALIVPAVSGENILRKRSPLVDKVGSRVLHPSLTILDNPFIDWETDTRLFDDEGHPTSRKPIFENGVFKTPLYDYYHAKLAGTEPTGNGYKPRPWSTPSPGPTNIEVHVERSNRSLEDLIGEVERGVMLVISIGAWLSNAVSGQINATVSLGYLIEKGSIVRPVKGLVIGGNIYEALGDKFIGAGGEVECDAGFCSPWLALGGISFA